MFTGRWLATIEYLIKVVFWGTGYFFGFNLVTVLSVGTMFAEEFSCIIRGREKQHRFWIFIRDGQIFLTAQVVSLVGWFFLATIVWIFALLFSPV